MYIYTHTCIYIYTGESKKRINEAGRKIEKGYKLGLYERWKEKVPQFTCFTSTKVQILTLSELQSKAEIQREGEDEDKSAYQVLSLLALLQVLSLLALLVQKYKD
jgi:hypothetical protein